jgi:DnaK suppressor protein
MMTVSEISQYKQRLLDLQAELMDREARIKLHARAGVPADAAEQVTARENDDVIQALDIQIRDQLVQISAALARLESGEYGACARCGERIEAARLDILPYTGVCSSCA